jgi:hypothetical protein
LKLQCFGYLFLSNPVQEKGSSFENALGMVVVVSCVAGGGRPVCNNLGGVVAVKNLASTSVVTGDGDVMRRYLDEGIVVAAITDPLVPLERKP